MTESKHTPGRLEACNGRDIYPAGDEGARNHVSDCAPDGYNEDLTDITPEIAEANARRMVACWNSHDDLLEALEGMVDAFGQLDDAEPAQDRAWDRAFSELAKAKGE